MLSKKYKARIRKRILRSLGVMALMMLSIAVISKTNLPENVMNVIKYSTKAQKIETSDSTYVASEAVIDADLYVSTLGSDETGDAFAHEPKVVGGYNHFVALKANGEVWTWGLNTNGQLGLGHKNNTNKPTQVKIDGEILSDAIDVAAGYYYTLILRQDGTVWAAGYNDYGQLGDGTKTATQTFKQVKLTEGDYLENIIDIAAGSATSYALCEDGTVYAWGQNNEGQLGQDNWDYSAHCYPLKMLNASNIIQVEAGYLYVSMLDADGSVWGVGTNGSGQLGEGGKANWYEVPIQMVDQNGNILYGVKEIATGYAHTVVLKEDGTVWAVGLNGNGQLGQGTTTTSKKLVQIKKESEDVEGETEAITDAKHISVAGYSTYISRKKDTEGNTQGMYVIGQNSQGQLFTKDKVNKTLATPVETGSDIITMALTKNTSGYQTGIIVDQDGMVYTVGNNANGEMGNETLESLTTPWCISKKKLNVTKNIINFEIAEETETINYNFSVAFNLLYNNISSSEVTFKSMDEKVATVDNTGKVTAKGTGLTFIKIYNKKYDLSAAVKVQVNEKGNITAPKVEGGFNHFVALKANGEVWTWGLNTNGQLGLDDKGTRNVPTKTNMKNVVDVAAGYYYTLILKQDGTVWASGRNNYGQLGDGTTVDTQSFHKVKLNDKGDYLENIIDIAAGSETSYALCADGTVYAWGANNEGQLGQDYYDSVAHGYPVKIQKVSNIIQIESGDEYISMLDADGSVWGVGTNGSGQLGEGGKATWYEVPIQMLDQNGNILYGVKEIATGTAHTVVLKEDGSVWGVGHNGSGQLGQGTTGTSKRLVQIKKESEDVEGETEVITDAKHISAAGYATYISRKKDTEGNTQGMYVIGQNSQGQLFTKDKVNKTLAIPVETDSDIITMALTKNTSGYQTGIIVDQDGMVYTVGFNENGEIGNETVQNLTTPWCISKKKLDVTNNIINFENAEETENIEYKFSMEFNLLKDEIPSSGVTFTTMDEDVATVDNTGKVTAKGTGSTFIKLYNERNALYAAVKVQVNENGNITAPKVEGGFNHFVALKANGEVWTWGLNSNGQLGLDHKYNEIKPTQVKIEGNAVSDAIDVAAGYYYTLILRKDGTVWVSGQNAKGQLGDGTTNDAQTFSKVKLNEEKYLENIIDIAAGSQTSYALCADGSVYAWGANNEGQLGQNYYDSGSHVYPVKIQKVSNIIQIEAEYFHVIMLDANGSVWGVGHNGNGQLGEGGKANWYTLPTQMLDQDGKILYGVKEIATGTAHTVVLKEDGSVWGVGHNGSGQLGQGTTGTSKRLVQIKKESEDVEGETEVITDVKHISAAGYATYISRKKNTEGNTQGMYVIGQNSQGQLFTKDTTNRTLATQVETNNDIITMALTKNTSGNQTGVIVNQDGMVYTVGYNANGEIGNETVQNLTTPWCISKLKIEVVPNVINYKNIGENTEKITQNITMGFNLLKDEIEGKTFEYTSTEQEVAEVSEEGIVTAIGIGSTFIKVHNIEHNVWAAVKVNVNGKEGETQPKIVGGYNHFVALKANGEVWTWGLNNNGQLGLDHKNNTTKPTQVKVEGEILSDAIDVAAGYNYTLILRQDGTVWAAGQNGKGQLGNGTTNGTQIFSKVKLGEDKYLENIIDIAAGSETSYALCADGSVYAWGANNEGQLGQNYYDTGAHVYPAKIQKVSNIIQIEAEYFHVIMLDANGSVWGVGHNGNGQLGDRHKANWYVLPTQMLDQNGNILYGVKEIATGTAHTVVLKEDGTVWGVGHSGSGQLGQGTSGKKYTTLVQIKKESEEQNEDIAGIEVEGITDAKHISAAGYATYISRKKDEEGNAQGMYVIGQNNQGQLFAKDTVNKTLAIPVETSKDIITMALTKNTGNQTGIIVDVNGNVYTVGYNANGEIGNETTEASVTMPVCISQVKLKVEPSIINYHKAGDTGEKIDALVSAGFNLLYNNIEQGIFEFKTMDKDIATADENGIVTATGIGTTFIQVYNELNDTYGAVRVQVNGTQGKTQAKIVGGGNHFVALKANGEVWTWGDNGSGQLGLGDDVDKTKPTKTDIYDSNDKDQEIYAVDVAAGQYHTMVLKSDGTVWTTGANGNGQLGDGTTTPQKQFVQVQGLPENVIAITANNSNSYALTEDGAVYGWGYNGEGQLGQGYWDYGVHSQPVRIQKISNAIQISAGNNYICILDASGTVWSVGHNGNGQLGLGKTGYEMLAQQMKSTDGTGILRNIKKVSAGASHTLLLTVDNTVYGVGYNGYYQLGNNTNAQKRLPVQMIDEQGNVVKNIKDIEANGHASILSAKSETKEGQTKAGIYVVGYNNYGQLFTKDKNTVQTLTKVQEDKNIIAMALTNNTSNQTSAIADDMGLVYTVGFNGNGEMGDESTTSTVEPTSISDAKLVVNTRKIILNLSRINAFKQIEAKTDLGFNILFDKVEEEEISYNSLDSEIAPVSASGVVTAKNYGETKIEVTTNKLPNTVLVDVQVLRQDDIAMPKVVSGQNFTVALKADGTVWTWGQNNSGQLGLGDKTNRYKPTKIDIEDVVSIAAGNNHAVLLTKDGKVYSFGDNSYNQLGRQGNNLIPQEIPGLENVIELAAGAYHSMALTNDGSIYTWGYNYNGQLGDGTSASKGTPIKIKANNICQISAANQTSAAIDGDGNLYVWGYNGYGQAGNGNKNSIYSARKVSSLENIIQVEVQDNTVMALDKNGEVWTAGYNAKGNLGNNSTKERLEFGRVIESIETTEDGQEEITYVSNVKTIKAGNNTAIAIKNDGTAITWGANAYAQMANGTYGNTLLPIELKYGPEGEKIDEIFDASIQENTIIVAREDGKVWSIGRNDYGQMGDGSILSKTEFVCISKPSIKFEQTPIRIKGIGKTENAKVSMAQGFNLLYNKVEESNFTYASRNESIVTVDIAGNVTSVKKGKTQIKVVETNTNQTSSVDVYVLGDEDITFPQIESSNYATLTLKSNGEVWGYGNNANGQLGTGDTERRTLPTYSGINNIMNIALGNNHAIAVDKDGYVWTWGNNSNGQLGNGETGGVSLSKVKVKSPDGAGYLQNIVAVAAGDSFSIALDKDGVVYGWGYNGNGQLGQGDTTARYLPTRIEGLEGITKIEVANQSVFAIDIHNNLWVAGYNGYGNLGDGTTDRKTRFVQITALQDVADVSASPTNSTLVLLLDGTVWGFGYNGYNALTNVGGAIPQQLQGPNGLLENVTSIGTGYYTGYAITAEEKVLAWGLNNYRQLATHDTQTKSIPVYMQDKDGNELTDVMLVSGGISNTEIAKNDGKVWSIGYNGYGELGDGSTTSQNEFVCISTQYIKLQDRQVTLKLSNPEYQINPQTVYGFNLLFDVAENNGFVYESLDSTIAEVDANTGKVTAKSLGRTYITLKSKDTEDQARVVIDVIAEYKQTVEKVQAGHVHTLALKQDGTIWSWGNNTQGELGNGKINDIKTTEPTQIEKGTYTEIKEEITEEGSTQVTTTQIEVEMNNIKDIAAGYYYNLAVDKDGKVYSWGYNQYGQLGDGLNEAKSIPTRIEGLQNIEKVYIHGQTSIALNEDGEIYTWGYGYGKTPTKLNFYSKVVDVHGKLMLTEDGSVWYLSSNPSRIADLSNIVEIASGDNYYAALDSKGKVWVWGYNGYGQLSQGNTSSNVELTTVKVQKEGTEELEELTNIVELKAGNNSLFMTAQDGSLYTSGYSANGQLGTESYEYYNRIATKALNMENTKLVDSYTYHSIASDQSGFVYTTGYNAQGQLGDGTYDTRNVFEVIGDTYVHVDANRVTIEEGDSRKVKASLDNKFNLIQDTVDSGNIKYESLNPEIATVEADGTIHGIEMGTVEIVVTHIITNKTATIFVQVVPETKVTVPKAETSDTHTVALKADGTVWTWGNNSNGQLGTGDSVQKTSPTQVRSIESAIDVSVGYYYTAVVDAEGKVWTFGHNGYGQLGDGTGSDRLEPVQVIKTDGAILEDIVKVQAGKYRTVALDEEGNVWIWGYGYGSSARKLTTVKNIIHISSNYAVDQLGEVYKINDGTKLDVTNIIRISEGENHALFLSKNGKGYSVGTNAKGQLGIGTIENASIPTLIQNEKGIQSMTDIKELKAGKETSMAILKNGDVYTWGSNENYKLGNNEDDYVVLPKKNVKTNVAISGFSGPNNTGIIDEEGFVYTWGLGDFGNLGNKLFNTVSEPVLVGREEVGLNEYDIVIHKDEIHQILVTNKTFNVLKEIEDTSEKTFEIGNSDIATVNADGIVTGQKEGKTTVIVTKADTGSVSIANVTVLPDDVTIEPMALTCMSHTVVLKANGTVWSYGLGTSYELGNGTSNSSDRPVQVKFPEGVVIKHIAVGNTHNLAVDIDGNVWGWGSNSNYALGTTASIPVKLGLNKIKKVFANNDQSMALTEDGYVYVWGQNSNGELGIGTYKTVTRPTLLNYVSNILDIAIGKNHTLLLTTEGKVLTSGLNVYGQTAKPEGKSNIFEQIEVPEIIGKIAAGDNHSVLLSAYGDVYTFGYNANGQLGTGNINNQTSPIKTTATNIMQISAGKGHTILLGEDRNLYSAGANSNGQLGIGTNDDKLQFTETYGSNMMSISCGNTYSVAIKYDGDVYAWGDYYHGIENIKTRTNSRVPVKIGNDSSYIDEPEITVNVDGTKQINVTPKYSFNVFKYAEDDVDFTYESIQNEIATVDEQGLVTGIKTGTTWVKVTELDTQDEKVVIVRVIEKDAKCAPQVAGGDGYASVLRADGSIWGYGYNSDGQLGNDTLAPINIPSQTNILATYKYVVTGERFTVALREDGTVWAWGDNTYGQLGQGNRQSAKKPVQVPGLTNIVAVSAGDNHCIALDNMGNVYTWGLNNRGQLGNYKLTTSTKPQKINSVGKQIISVSAGGNLTAMVDTTGEVYVFGDNFNEQLEELEYRYDEFGQIMIPALNYFIATPRKIEAITNAVKVDCLDNGIVILKEDGSVVEFTKYAVELIPMPEMTTIAFNNIVDISATNGSVMLLDKDGNIYTYGDNSKGQAGIGITSGDESTRLITISEGKTFFAVGTGYKNNYAIDTEGFVWAAGDNEYGQLGNSSYESSYLFTLTGDRKFEIVPDSKIMKQPEEETVTIKSNLFNVFNNNQRILTDYEWTSSNDAVATVEDGVIVAQDMGEATITATDKVTGATAKALRVVMPIDEDRLNILSVNGVDAKVTGEYKYEVSVVPNLDGTGTLKISTKDITDQISIDSGVSYVTAELEQSIALDTNPKEVKIKVKATNGRTVDYFLTINVLSNDASLKLLTVKINDVEIEATPIDSTKYEIVVSDTVTKPEVHAVANNEKATVCIDGGISELKEMTKTVNMTTANKKTVPIVVTAESGAKVNYTLTIYKEDALTELESVKVGDEYATQLNDKTYKIIIPKDKESVEVTATTLYSKADVNISLLGAETHVSTRTVGTSKDETIVEIYVTYGEKEEKYTLYIVKEGTEDILGLFSVVVGETPITPVGKVYTAYVSNLTEEVEVTAKTINPLDKITIGENETKVHESTVILSTLQETNTYTIRVTDPEDETNYKEYTLNIKKPSADNSLNSITVGNSEFSKEAVRVKGTNTYRVNISDKYQKVEVTAKANYGVAQVSINEEEYETEVSTREITISETKPTVIDIVVKAQNGDTQTYKLEIYDEDSNTNLSKVYVKVGDKQVEVLPSKLDPSTYEYTLDRIATKLNIGAITQSETAMVGINTFAKEEHETYRDVDMVGRQTIVKIPVTAEDGTTKTYRLVVNALPDNVNLELVKVAGVKADKVPVNKYEARVNKNAESFDLYVKAQDPKAKIQINGGEAVTGPVNTQITKSSEEVTVKITVIAQDGTSQDYTLVVTNQSSDNKLAILNVDGEKIEPGVDGVYRVNKKFLTESVKVQAIANNKYATVSINETTPETEEQTSLVTVPDAENIIKIKVTAEDGTSAEYTLIVTKLPNETGVTIYTVKEKDGVTTLKEIELDGNKGTAKIGTDTIVKLQAVAKDKLAKVSINGSIPEAEKTTQEVPTTEETTVVSVQVTAQDGTIATYQITLQKSSTNNNLEKLEAEGIEESDILKTGDTYTIKMPDTWSELELTATAEDEAATVKIADGEYSTSKEGTKTITVDGETKEISIWVKAEDGSEKEYKVTIEKVTDLSLKEVEVDGNDWLEEDNGYVAFIDADQEESTLKIVPNNPKALISTKIGTEDYSEEKAQETHTKQIKITSAETVVLIKAQDPADETRIKEYTLTIKHKSADAGLETLLVDENKPIEQEGIYYAYTTTEATTAKVYVKANNKYASIIIGTSEAKQGENTQEVKLDSGKTTEVIVTITSQDKKITNSFKVIIERKSKDTGVEILFNTAEEKADEIDEKTLTYTKYIERDVTEVLVKVKTNSDVASIEMAGETAIHEISQTVQIEGETTQIDAIVTAESGDKVTYHINIVKKSTDYSISTVKVDGQLIEEIEGKYVAQVFDKGLDSQDAIIEVITNNKNAKVQIGDGSEWQGHTGTATKTFQDGNRTITLNINIQAQDSNTAVDTKQLTINLVSDDVSIKTVKNGENVVTHYNSETFTFTEFLDKSVEEVSLAIEANNVYTTLTSGDTTGTGIISLNNLNIKDQEEVSIKFTAIAETGRTQEYTIILARKSDNANAEHIYVDGIDILDTFENIDSVPTSIITIGKSKDNVLIEVLAENEYANIKIGDTDIKEGHSLENIKLDTEKNTITVPIVITSQDGNVTKTYNIMFVRESNDTSIQWLEVNDIHVEEDEDGNYEITLKASETKAVVEITLSNILAKVTMGGDEGQGTLTETILLPESGSVVKTIKITAIDGTVRTCTLTINKQENDLGLDKVYLNNRIAKKIDDTTFEIDVQKGTTIADIKAVAAKASEYVQINNNTKAQGENTYKDCSLEEKEIPIKVISMFDEEVDQEKEYTLIIKEVEEPNVVEDLKVTIKIDEEEIKQDTDGNYVKIVSNSTDNVELWAGVSSETSKVKITDKNGEGEFETPSSQRNISLQTDATEVQVTVQNGALEEKVYNVYILKDTEDIKNANLNEIIAGAGAVTEGKLSPEKDGTYTTYIKKDATSIELTATSTYPYAKVNIDGKKDGRGSSTQLIEMGDADEKQVVVAITSADGTTINQYIVNIYREPEELELKEVYVDERKATKVDENNYTIDIVKGTTQVDLKAILYNSAEYVSIAGNEATAGENEFDSYQISNGMKITIITSNGLDKTAADYKEKEYTLTLTEVNNVEDLSDLQLTIKVSDKKIEKQEDGIYIATVGQNEQSAIVEAISTSITTQVKIGETEFRVKSSKETIKLSENITKVIITAKNGAEDQVEYELYIVKENTAEIADADLGKLYADEDFVKPGDDNKYPSKIEVEVKASKESVTIKAIASQALALVSIDGDKGVRGSSEKSIDMKDCVEKEITITITAIDGTTKDYTVIIKKLSLIKGKVITQSVDQENQSATIIVYNSEDTREEDDIEDPRKVVKQITIQKDGSFELDLPTGKYDIVVKKDSYLEYRLTNIETVNGETVELEDIYIYAGDVVVTGEIEIDDLVALTDNYGEITEANKEEKAIYDLNEDGTVNSLDKNILKTNYGKLAEKVEWVNPKAVAAFMLQRNTEAELILPMACEYVITSEYGTRTHPVTGVVKKHTGIDISGEHHTEILAVASGEVTYAGVQNGFGNCVEIKHIVNGETIYSFYAHLSRIDVEVGENVVQGQTIGLEGGDPDTDPNPGSSTGHHLHFEIRTSSGYGNDVDPTGYINF